jgi:hypothetical protein
METYPVLQESEIKVSEGRYPSQMVLRQVKEKTYATHIKVYPPNGEPFFILGHYFFKLEDAEEDFRRRAIELGAFVEEDK